MNKRGGKRTNAGRKAKIEKTVTISFRVFSIAEPQIKEYLKKLSVKERTELLLAICSNSI